MAHPQFTPKAANAQHEIISQQGKNNLWFAGAWSGFGFHEDGIRAGLQVATSLSGERCSWMAPENKSAFVPQTAAPNKKITLGKRISNSAGRMLSYAVYGFMKSIIQEGYLVLRLPNGEKTSFGNKETAEEKHCLTDLFRFEFHLIV